MRSIVKFYECNLPYVISIDFISILSKLSKSIVSVFNFFLTIDIEISTIDFFTP